MGIDKIRENSFYTDIDKELGELKRSNSFRQLVDVESSSGSKIVINGKSYINLNSNDYLGLASDRLLLDEFYESLKKSKSTYKSELCKFGSTSSRLLTGNHHITSLLENRISEIYSKYSENPN